jgi:hypothetical protein
MSGGSPAFFLRRFLPFPFSAVLSSLSFLGRDEAYGENGEISLFVLLSGYWKCYNEKEWKRTTIVEGV